MTQEVKLQKAFRHLFLANECLAEGKRADVKGFKARVKEVEETLNTSLLNTPNKQADYLKDLHLKQWESKINNTYEYHMHKVWNLIGADLKCVINLPDFGENPYGL